MEERFPVLKPEPVKQAPAINRAESRVPGLRFPPGGDIDKGRQEKAKQRAAKKAERQRRKAGRKGGAR